MQNRPLFLWEQEALERIAASGPRGTSLRDAVALYEPDPDYEADYLLVVIGAIKAHNDGTCGDDCPVPPVTRVDLDVRGPGEVMWCRVADGSTEEPATSVSLLAAFLDVVGEPEMASGLVAEHIARRDESCLDEDDGYLVARLADEESDEYQSFLAKCREIRDDIRSARPGGTGIPRDAEEDSFDDAIRFTVSLILKAVHTLITGPALTVPAGFVVGTCSTRAGGIMLTLARRETPLHTQGAEPLEWDELIKGVSGGFDALIREVSLYVVAVLEDLADDVARDASS
ncbi:MAG: hypothetical protein ACYCST_16970 [Acidimicrobiales bacterium]